MEQQEERRYLGHYKPGNGPHSEWKRDDHALQRESSVKKLDEMKVVESLLTRADVRKLTTTPTTDKIPNMS